MDDFWVELSDEKLCNCEWGRCVSLSALLFYTDHRPSTVSPCVIHKAAAARPAEAFISIFITTNSRDNGVYLALQAQKKKQLQQTPLHSSLCMATVLSLA
jgi:hypothetical protein